VLSIGGWDNGDLMDRDPVPQGLLLFDMMALEWRDTYDAGAAEYERAPSLQEWYKNGSVFSLYCRGERTGPPTNT